MSLVDSSGRILYYLNLATTVISNEGRYDVPTRANKFDGSILELQ